MTDLQEVTDRQSTAGNPSGRVDLTGAHLPSSAPWIVAAVALAAGALVWVLGAGLGLAVIVLALVMVGGLAGWSLIVEGRRKGVDRFVAALVWVAFALAMIPLVSLIWTVVANGVPALNGAFFTQTMRNILGEGGGIYHAIMGTVIITALAALISIPLGVLAAIWLVEYGSKTKLARIITFLVDVMTGIPSIVAGLFALGLFILITGDPLPRLGIGGSVALSLLMLPTVVRSTEEMLKLVPNDLREASYALGVPKWKTIMKVVLPTSVAGIVTGITLSVARVAGETAPLLIIAGTNDSYNANPFNGSMMTIPVFIYTSMAKMFGTDADIWRERVWGAALVLIIIVMSLNLLARVIGKVFAPKTGR